MTQQDIIFVAQFLKENFTEVSDYLWAHVKELVLMQQVKNRHMFICDTN